MNNLIGTSWPVFIGVTCLLLGFAAYMTGQAVANAWQPLRRALVYCAALALGARFLTFALFDGELLSLTGYLLGFVVLGAIAWFAYGLTRADKMVSQYPWLYQRAGSFGWRDKTDVK